MKGPYQRLKFDLRRLWECPACNRRERTAGSVSYCFCQCQEGKADGQPVVMKLIADGPQRVIPPFVMKHDREDELVPSAMDRASDMASLGVEPMTNAAPGESAVLLAAEPVEPPPSEPLGATSPAE
jgi:hypothetical protein